MMASVETAAAWLPHCAQSLIYATGDGLWPTGQSTEHTGTETPMSVLLKPTAILLLCASLLNAYGDSSGGKIPEVTASAIPVISATSADTLTVTWADMPGDYALTRTGNTEETRTGDVTRTITGNVTESIENGSVTINNKDRKSTRLNSSHVKTSYAVFCLKKKIKARMIVI